MPKLAHYIQLARQDKLALSLPPRLIRFFQRFPPAQLFPNEAPAAASTHPYIAPTTSTSTSTSTFTTSPTDPNVSAVETPALETTASAPPEASAADLGYHNPFLPRKDFRTGRWYGPMYGLRKQADLVKLANTHGVVDLLPWTIKKPGEKEQRRVERGLRVKGTGVGEKVKGKVWERTLKSRLEARRQAMLDMPRMIQEWKQVSHIALYPWTYAAWIANLCTEGTWSWLEEVAEWKGSIILRDRGSGYCRVHLSLLHYGNISTEFG
jgi:large subunit ribosomal protein L25